MKQKGSSLLIIIFVITLLIAVASTVSYYVLMSQGKAPQVTNNNLYQPSVDVTPEPESAASQGTSSPDISDKNDTDTLEEEFKNTSTENIDSDFQDLDNSASSL